MENASLSQRESKKTSARQAGVKPYKCIFFDLDHTLWDYETNSCDTLDELYISYNLKHHGVHDIQSFKDQFKKINTELWDQYDRGLITNDVIRKQRFKRILEYFHVHHEKLTEDLSTDYLNNCPKKGNLIPNAIEILQYLSEYYALTVVTNGFDEIQNIKLTAGNLHSFFNHIVTSQKAGHRKPSAKIFDYAMKANGVKCQEVIMIGDNLVTDIGGAHNASIDTVFFNPEKMIHTTRVKHEIHSLAELKNIL
jgi:YjjG family noncanonical pyrimidine nucleotidase